MEGAVMDIESGGIGAAVGVVTTAVATAAVKIFGSRKERSDDRAAATAEWRTLAAEARKERQACEERATKTEALVEEMRATVSSIEGHYVALQIEHAACPVRIAELETRLHALERESEPPEAA